MVASYERQTTRVGHGGNLTVDYEWRDEHPLNRTPACVRPDDYVGVTKHLIAIQ